MSADIKKILWILGIIVAVAVVGGTFFFVKSLLVGPTQTPGQTQSGKNVNTTSDITGVSPGSYPNSNTSNLPPITNGISVAVQGGDMVTIKDFKHDPNTVVDPQDQNTYYLFGGYEPTSSSTPFSIFYRETNQSFNITLLQEPIGTERLNAEQYLKEHLGIGETQLCQLNHSVLVPGWVNQIYAGRDLRFSFCTDATPL